MKKLTTSALLILLTVSVVFSQSKSYEAIREKFRGEENVFAMQASGMLARTVLWVAGEREFKNAIEDVRHVRFVVIPKALFASKGVTVNGFTKFAKEEESFEEVARVKEHG